MALSRKTRQFIVGVLIIAFCVIAPILILYARGYRYSFQEKEVQKVGMIMLAYDPLAASSNVNGESAPFDITAFGYDRYTDLTEGIYHAEVTLDGYHTWRKNLDVKPEVVTWSRYITLFLTNSNPKSVATMPTITTQDFSPDREWLCTAGQDDQGNLLEITSLKEDGTSQQLRLSDLAPQLANTNEVFEINFAPDSTQILLTLKNETGQETHVIFSRELGAEEPITILENILPNLRSVRWHPSTPTVVYALQGQDLYRISVPEKTSKKLASGVLGFDPNKSGLYFIRPREEQIREEPQASLKRMGLDGASPETLSEDIELAESYKIATSAAERLAVQTAAGHLYVVLPKDEKTERIATDTDSMEWSIDNDEENSTDELLLYANEHEIYVYDPTIQNSEAITRYTDTIENAIWYVGNYKYIIFTVNGRLKIIELDERGERNIANIWEVGTAETIAPNSLFIDNNAEHLFVTVDSSDEDAVTDFTIRE